MLVTGLIVAYGYASEIFLGWLGGNEFEWSMTTNRIFGPYAPGFWALMLCNVIVPQSLWFKRVRVNAKTLWIVSVIINIGMWLERYVIVITSLHRDFLPSSWGMYYPTIWDWATFIGTIGFFLLCVLLFIRVLPAISIFEMRELVHETSAERAK
jgi:molybdopterin-containing oxidoreductase family membrane subunit